MATNTVVFNEKLERDKLDSALGVLNEVYDAVKIVATDGSDSSTLKTEKVKLVNDTLDIAIASSTLLKDSTIYAELVKTFNDKKYTKIK